MAEYSQIDSIPEIALEWRRAGKGVALATVLETWGSAPRPRGSLLAVNEQAEMVGSVSGGCVEGAVVASAIDSLADFKARTLEFGVADEDAFAVGLACGGRIRILVDPVGKGCAFADELLERLVRARNRKRPCALLMNPDDSTRMLVVQGEDRIDPQVRARLNADRSDYVGEVFVATNNPPLRLIVVGAVHIAQALIPMARIAGYGVTLIDPRQAFGSEQRFPGESITLDWPDQAIGDLRPDSRTAVVTLSHDPKIDDPAIITALDSDAFYLGCLGSTRTHRKRVERLKRLGIGKQSISRIKAPVGADIAAQSPAEIAISIMAEITATLRSPVS